MKRIIIPTLFVLVSAQLWSQIEIKSSFFEKGEGVAEGEMHVWEDTLYVYNSSEFEIRKYTIQGSYLGSIRGSGLQFQSFTIDPKSGQILLNEGDGVYKLSHNGSASAIEKLKNLKIQEIFIWKDSVCYLCSNGWIFNSENNLREAKFIDKHASAFLKGVTEYDNGLVFRWYEKIVIWKKSSNTYQTLEIDKDIPITDYANYAFIDRFGWLWVGSGTLLYYFDGNNWKQVLEANNPLYLMLDAQGNVIFNNEYGGYILKNKLNTTVISGDIPRNIAYRGLNYEFYNDHYRTWDGKDLKTYSYPNMGPLYSLKKRTTIYKNTNGIFVAKGGVLYHFNIKEFNWGNAQSVKDYGRLNYDYGNEIAPLEDGRTLIRNFDDLFVWNIVNGNSYMLFNIPNSAKRKRFFAAYADAPFIDKGNEIGFIENNGYRWIKIESTANEIDTMAAFNKSKLAYIDGLTGRAWLQNDGNWQRMYTDNSEATKGISFDNEGNLFVYYDNYYRVGEDERVEFNKLDRLNAFSNTSVWLMRNDSLYFYNGLQFQNVSAEIGRTFESVGWLQYQNARSVWVQDAKGLHLITLPIPTSIGYEENSNMEIFPNPCSDIINLKGAENANFIIFNSQGQQVLHGKTQGSINIGTLPKGIYFLQLAEYDKRFMFLKD